ncbi:MAG: aminotransferase class IV [Chitinophagales bacterium]
MSFINFNGKILLADSPVFSLNRAMNYGDGMLEGMRIHNGEILFFEDHLDRMFRAMKALKLEVRDDFTAAFFHKQIIDLGRASQIGNNARVRIGIFRSGGGLYEPQSNTSEFFIEIIPMEKGYEWNDSMCEVAVFPDVQKYFSSISFFKSMNALAYVMAAIFKKEKNLDDCFLLNSDGKIADAISSNLFWIEKGKIFSPTVSDGGVDGVMRKNLIRLLPQNNFSFEEKSIKPDELKSADEVFLTNVGWAIKPVTHFEGKIFQTEIAKQLFILLMESLS